MSVNELILVYITTSNETEAREIGKILVSERLAACVNILPKVYSIYHWEQEVVEDEESILIAKTTIPLLDPLTKRVITLHSYSVPCIVAIPIDGGNSQYFQWIKDETKAQ